eukprot:CAMPEP_0115370666 /NCGR_PEP_ID=MMETSP0270-20121206/106948_1 /TAXON_ID=71861 /ORGANISM="Scrippsiella trochoidea, Strain CCMP3099" /LENGTH=580 /DNA_ID=CAMNT_0002793495 /DNA_START=411 /DNA_END=2153 /DNA_ORIENTATION=+
MGKLAPQLPEDAFAFALLDVQASTHASDRAPKLVDGTQLQDICTNDQHRRELLEREVQLLLPSGQRAIAGSPAPPMSLAEVLDSGAVNLRALENAVAATYFKCWPTPMPFGLTSRAVAKTVPPLRGCAKVPETTMANALALTVDMVHLQQVILPTASLGRDTSSFGDQLPDGRCVGIRDHSLCDMVHPLATRNNRDVSHNNETSKRCHAGVRDGLTRDLTVSRAVGQRAPPRRGHFLGALGKAQRLRKVYVGGWKDDKRHGRGTCFFKNGEFFQGSWDQGKMHGHGTLRYANGDLYVGEWHEGLRSGKGTLNKANGDCYEGYWLNDKREGSGSFFYSESGKVFVGEWANDLPKAGIYTQASANPEQASGVPTTSVLPAIRLALPTEVLEGALAAVRNARKAVRAKGTPVTRLFTEEEIHALQDAFQQAMRPDGLAGPLELQALLSQLGTEMHVDRLQELLVSAGYSPEGGGLDVAVNSEDFLRLVAVFLDEEAGSEPSLREDSLEGYWDDERWTIDGALAEKRLLLRARRCSLRGRRRRGDGWRRVRQSLSLTRAAGAAFLGLRGLLAVPAIEDYHRYCG